MCSEERGLVGHCATGGPRKSAGETEDAGLGMEKSRKQSWILRQTPLGHRTRVLRPCAGLTTDLKLRNPTMPREDSTLTRDGSALALFPNPHGSAQLEASAS